MTRPRPVNTRPLLDDRGWLDQAYAVEQRAVADIADEAGADPSNVWRALARHRIPLRGRGDVENWAAYLTPDVLQPYLDDGWSAAAIGRDLGCNHSTVIEAMARHQLLDVDPAEARQLHRWYERDGLSIAEVAARLGCHPRSARRRLLAAGVTIRPAGRRTTPP